MGHSHQLLPRRAWWSETNLTWRTKATLSGNPPSGPSNSLRPTWEDGAGPSHGSGASSTETRKSQGQGKLDLWMCGNPSCPSTENTFNRTECYKCRTPRNKTHPPFQSNYHLPVNNDGPESSTTKGNTFVNLNLKYA